MFPFDNVNQNNNFINYPTHSNVPQFANYDPLTVQFLTGGYNKGMQYLPQPQFLTPPSYGIFRSTPLPSLTPDYIQRATFLQNYLIANQGRLPFINIPYLIDTYNPSVSSYRYEYFAKRRLQDDITAMKAAGMNLGSSIATSAVVTGALSLTPLAPVAPLIGMGAGFFAPKVGDWLSERRAIARKVQEYSMSKVFSGPNVDRVLGQGFDIKSSYALGGGIKELAAEDVIFKKDDYLKMYKLGLEAGMFDYSTTSMQHLETLKKLKNNFEFLMKLYETADLDELGETVRRLQTMGAGLSSYVHIAAQESMFRRMLGITQKEMVATYGQQGSLIYSQVGATPYLGSLSNISNAANITLMQRLGLLTPSEIARSNGVSGMAQSITTSTASYSNNVASPAIVAYLSQPSGFREIDQKRLKEVMSSPDNIYKAYLAGSTIIKNPEEYSKFIANKNNLMEQIEKSVGPNYNNLVTAGLWYGFYKETYKKPPTKEEMVSYLSKSLNLKPEEAEVIYNSVFNPQVVGELINQQKVNLSQYAYEKQAKMSYENQFFNRIKKRVSKGFLNFQDFLFGKMDYATGVEEMLKSGQIYSPTMLAPVHVSKIGEYINSMYDTSVDISNINTLKRDNTFYTIYDNLKKFNNIETKRDLLRSIEESTFISEFTKKDIKKKLSEDPTYLDKIITYAIKMNKIKRSDILSTDSESIDDFIVNKAKDFYSSVSSTASATATPKLVSYIEDNMNFMKVFNAGRLLKFENRKNIINELSSLDLSKPENRNKVEWLMTSVGYVGKPEDFIKLINSNKDNPQALRKALSAHLSSQWGIDKQRVEEVLSLGEKEGEITSLDKFIQQYKTFYDVSTKYTASWELKNLGKVSGRIKDELGFDLFKSTGYTKEDREKARRYYEKIKSQGIYADSPLVKVAEQIYSEGIKSSQDLFTKTLQGTNMTYFNALKNSVLPLDFEKADDTQKQMLSQLEIMTHYLRSIDNNTKGK